MHGREVPEEVSYYPAWLYGRSLQLRDVRVLRDRQCAWVHCGNRANLVKLTCMCAVHLSSALGTRMLSYTMPWLDSLRVRNPHVGCNDAAHAASNLHPRA